MLRSYSSGKPIRVPLWSWPSENTVEPQLKVKDHPAESPPCFSLFLNPFYCGRANILPNTQNTPQQKPDKCIFNFTIYLLFGVHSNQYSIHSKTYFADCIWQGGKTLITIMKICKATSPQLKAVTDNKMKQKQHCEQKLSSGTLNRHQQKQKSTWNTSELLLYHQWRWRISNRNPLETQAADLPWLSHRQWPWWISNQKSVWNTYKLLTSLDCRIVNGPGGYLTRNLCETLTSCWPPLTVASSMALVDI